MADPVGVAFAPGDDAFGTAPTWVRLDDPAETDWGVAGWTIDRGRNTELDQTDTGSARVTIVDRSGAFDPTNVSSPFYGGGLDPNRQAAIRIRNPDTGDYRYLFRGFVAGWEIEMDPATNNSLVTLELEDGLAMLSATHMSPGIFGDVPPAASEGDIYWAATDGTEQVRKRLNDILDQIGWTHERHIFSGNISLPVTVYSRGESALVMMRDCADAEMPAAANLLCSRRGGVIFRGRYARFNPESYVTTDDDDLRTGPAGTGGRLVFWEVGGIPEALADPTVARLSTISFRRGKEDVINSATVVPKLGDDTGVTDGDVEDLTFTDSASVVAYGWRTVEYDDLLILQGNTPPGQTAKEEAAFMGEFLVENYKQPKNRVTQLGFNPVNLEDPTASALWAFMLGVEIGDVIHLQTTHFGGNPATTTKVMMVDASSGDSFAQFDFAADQTDVWVTFDVLVPAATLSAWTTFSGYLAALWNIDIATSNGAAYVSDTGSGLVWVHDYAQGGTTTPVADEWHTIEYHAALDGVQETISLYMDGALVDSSTGPPTDATPHQQLQVGIVSHSAGVLYFDNIKVGTTRQGSQVFSDDFEAETFDAWTATTGDVSIVDAPFPQRTGPGFDEEFFVEGIRYECLPGQPIDTGVPNLRMELDVSPRTFYSHNPWGTTVDDETPAE